MLPDSSPLALALCCPSSWMNAEGEGAVLDAIRSGAWAADLIRADATWAGGVLHHVLLGTAEQNSTNGNKPGLDPAKRVALVSALLEGGVAPVRAPGPLAPSYRLDPRTVGWLAHAERHPDPAAVGRAMGLVSDWVRAAWASCDLKPAKRWLGDHGLGWESEVEGMPLWVHAALGGVLEGLEYERPLFLPNHPASTARGGYAYQSTKDTKETLVRRVKEILRQVPRPAQDSLVRLFKGAPKRGYLKKNPAHYTPVLGSLAEGWPSSRLFEHFSAVLRGRWAHASMGTDVSVGWTGVLEIWNRRWHDQQSILELMEYIALPNSMGYGAVPEDVLANPPVDAEWVQQVLVACAVVGHFNPAVYAPAMEDLKRLAVLHPGLPSWKPRVLEALGAYPLRPTRLDLDVRRALELECLLPEPSAQTVRARF